MAIRIPALVAAIFGFAGAAAALTVDDEALTSDDGRNWLAYGRTYDEQRYSPLTAVDTETVDRLGLAWYLDLPEGRSQLATPLVVDGVMYFTSSFSRTRAVDTRTGKVLWEYDPESVAHAGDRRILLWDSSKGLAFWKGKVVIATIDGRLIALDAGTGEKLWETLTVDPRKGQYVTGAPKVFKGKVIIGNGGTETSAARGYVTAYDVDSGKLAWRFWVVPGNPADGFENPAMAMAAKTWTGEWWKYGGGGNTWNGITYDPEFDQVLIGTGNGSPWNQKIRSPEGGDNLFLCSIVAVDADTGVYKWHYQTTPGETWDYNSNMDIVLADLPYGGRTVKALMHAPKNGFFYVINRENGELLSAEKIGKVTWASHVDLKSGRPVEIAGARYEDGEELVWPSAFGTHNWHAMSYNPQTGLVYIPTIELPGKFSDKGVDIRNWHSPNFYVDTGTEFGEADAPADAGFGALRAWDPVKQEKVWEVPLPGVWNPGTLTTAGGLVVQGRADGELVAYRATDGEILWQTNVGSGISAPPITYVVDGRQYISLLVGWGGAGTIAGSLASQHGWAYKAHPRRLLTFALDGAVPMPPSPPPVFPKPLEVPGFVVDADKAAHGRKLFSQHCAGCHGGGAVSGGAAPDLRASPAMATDAVYRDIMLNGSRQRAGMLKFADFDDVRLEALQHFVRQQARLATTGAVAQQP